MIEKLNPSDKPALKRLYHTVTAALRKNGVKQWDWFYPNGFVIGRDLGRGSVYGIREKGEIVAAIVVDRQFSARYAGLTFQDKSGTPAGIHRLVVSPVHQGKGIGKKLLHFAEDYAKDHGSTSIRLDVFSGNPGAVALYEQHGYQRVGAVRYPMRKMPYWCMEKML